MALPLQLLITSIYGRLDTVGSIYIRDNHHITNTLTSSITMDGLDEARYYTLLSYCRRIILFVDFLQTLCISPGTCQTWLLGLHVQNHRCLVEIALEVHQHWMTAQIIKSSPLKSGILPLIQTPEQFHCSCLVSLKVQLMRARGGEAAEPNVYATFDTKRCPGRDESTQQQSLCWDILCLNGRFGFKWDPATSGAASPQRWRNLLISRCRTLIFE